MADLETIGVRAVFENLGGYLTGAKKMEDVNKRLERSQVNLQNVSEASAIAQRRAQQRVVDASTAVSEAVINGNAKIRTAQTALATTQETVNRRITQSQQKVADIQRTLSATAVTETAKRVRLSQQLANAQVKLDNVTVAGQAQVARSAAALTATQNAVANSVARAARTEIAAFQGVADAAVISGGKIKQAQLGVAAAGGQVARGVGVGSVALRVFGAAGNVAHGITQKLGSALIAVTGFSNRFAVALRFGAAAIGAFTLGAIISEAAQFETALAKIDILTNATASGVSFLRDELLEMARTIPKSPDELGAAAYQVLSSGFDDVNEAAGITEIAAKAATLGLGTTAEVARVVTSVINAYGKENINAAQATDILVASIREGSAEAPDFVQNIGRLLGLAPLLGVEFDQLAAGIAGLTNVGLPANQAVTALLGILNQLASPAEGAKELLEEYGTSIEEVRQNIDEKGLLAGLRELITLFGNNQQVLEKLFPEVRGLTGALLLLNDGGAETDHILASIQNSAGVTEEGFARMSETFGFQAALLKNQLNVVLIELGSAILPKLTRALQGTITWIERNRESIANFAQEAINVAGIIGKNFVAGLAVVQTALSWIPSNEARVVAAILAIGAAFVIALGPASAAVVALIATIALLGAMSRAVDEVKSKLGVGSTGKSSQDINSSFNDLTEQSAASGKAIGTGDTRDALGKGAKNFTEAAIARITADLNANAQKMREAKTAEAQAKAAEEGEKLKIQLDQVTRAYADQELAAGGASKVTDALSDGIIDFAEAQELGLSAIAAGAAEASAIQSRAAETAFNYTKALSAVANAFQRGADIAKRVVLNLAKTGLEATQSAASAIFARPTREVARLELALARLKLANSSLIRSLDAGIKSLQKQLVAFDVKDAARQAARSARDFADQMSDLNEELSKAKDPEERAGIREQINDLNQQRADQLEDDAAAKQRKAIEDEIAKREEQIEKLEEQENSIQRQIDTYNLQNEVLQKQIQASDATLLSQSELSKAALEVARVTGEQSIIIRELSRQLGIDLIPEMDEMRRQAAIVRGAFEVLNNETLRAQFIPTVEVATTKTEALAKKTDETTLSLDAFKLKMDEITTTTLSKFIEFGENGLPTGAPSPFAAKARGGFTYRPTMTLLGEGNKPELTLPLTDASRSRELLRAIPASITAGLGAASSGGSSSAFGDISVQGYVPSELENVVISRIRKESARSRRMNKLVGL